ncbi:MAG: hypothetical protein SFV21_14580 [Rhodospirillaceae bacterium]|nr:hypothetical protein [Rhodospirillaceae bacterium]
MVKLQVELSEQTAQAARDAGLLAPAALEQLFADALRRRQAVDRLLDVAGRVNAAGIAPMPMEEINAEVKAARAERRADRRAGRR